MKVIRKASLGLAAILVAAAVFTQKSANAADYKPFTGEKTTWHNAFDRYDFSMDDATGAITPMTAPANEVLAIIGCWFIPGLAADTSKLC